MVKTNKKIIIVLGCLAIAFMLLIVIWSIVSKENENEEIIESESNTNEIEDYVEFSNSEVSTYNEVAENEIKEETDEVDSSLNEDDMRYLIKSVDNYISIYYLTDENEEILYKETTISVEYLSQADIDDLEVGIEVTGKEELNKTLEDFE